MKLLGFCDIGEYSRRGVVCEIFLYTVVGFSADSHAFGWHGCLWFGVENIGKLLVCFFYEFCYAFQLHVVLVVFVIDGGIAGVVAQFFIFCGIFSGNSCCPLIIVRLQ